MFQFEIKVEVTFSVDLYEPYPCQAMVKLILPTEPNTHGLPTYLVSPRQIVMDESLNAEWGYELKNNEDQIVGRYNSKLLFDSSWKALQQQINDYVSAALDTLSKTVEHNRLLLVTQPENYDTTFVIK